MSDDPATPTDIDLTDTPATPAAKPEEAAPASPEPSPPPTAEERIAALEAEKAELRERMLRIAADADNARKRARKEQADSEAHAREAVLRDFLEIIDNLERATAAFSAGATSDGKSIREGVDLVLRQFRTKLERYQVKPVDAVGLPFDPRCHEAVSQLPTADVKPGSVVHELQKGYAIAERLLRPALVVVAAAPPPPAPADEGAAAAAADATESKD
jgi:molecular chaperone GrpE